MCLIIHVIVSQARNNIVVPSLSDKRVTVLRCTYVVGIGLHCENDKTQKITFMNNPRPVEKLVGPHNESGL